MQQQQQTEPVELLYGDEADEMRLVRLGPFVALLRRRGSAAAAA